MARGRNSLCHIFKVNKIRENEKNEISTKIESRCEVRDMGLGVQKDPPAVSDNDFWRPKSALALLKKIIKFWFLVGSEGGSAPKFGPAPRREIRNRHGRVPGREK